MKSKMLSPKNFFISGNPGIGKTTLIKESVLPFKNLIGGFVTEEIIEDGKRMGFLLKSLAGPSGILASKKMAGPVRLKKYGLDLSVLDTIAVPSLKDCLAKKKIAVIDEIGAMEIMSDGLREAVMQCLGSSIPVLATLRAKSEPFTDSIKRLEQSAVLTLTRSNYQEVKAKIRLWIEEVQKTL